MEKHFPKLNNLSGEVNYHNTYHLPLLKLKRGAWSRLGALLSEDMSTLHEERAHTPCGALMEDANMEGRPHSKGQHITHGIHLENAPHMRKFLP